jgi:hypothetical protein
MHSLCRCLDTFAHHRRSFDETEIYTHDPLFTGGERLAWRV